MQSQSEWGSLLKWTTHPHFNGYWTEQKEFHIFLLTEAHSPNFWKCEKYEFAGKTQTGVQWKEGKRTENPLNMCVLQDEDSIMANKRVRTEI